MSSDLKIRDALSGRHRPDTSRLWPRPLRTLKPPSPCPSDDNGSGSIACAEARSHAIVPVKRSHPTYAHMRGSDGIGVVCDG